MELIDKERLKSRFRDECGRLKCTRWDISAIMDEIDNAPIIAPPPNPPLTLEELREMDGESPEICGGTGLPCCRCQPGACNSRRKPEEGQI